ncbi:hypothetical protein [Methanogenium organophilum]|uniref:Uncharacterized protein n=1 Tax=Methanogenium organophilum TaxID=2199 RepID=A0A9X9S296_METOG|nr:hypothetical protein [Methanogenium organophilum]WAI00217.1 hypothetical protein OU421_07170 [Methanogenium organophilum]
MTKYTDIVRKRLGWCPNADAVRKSRCTGVEQDCEHAWKRGGPDPGAAPESDAPAATPPGYQENILLILIAVAWLFPVVYQQEFLFLLMVISAVAVYCDAQNIHAGEKFEKETLLGDIVAWRPLTWGAATFVGGIIIMAIYLFHRKEIYTANMGKASS